jgi:hypothetical protein
LTLLLLPDLLGAEGEHMAGDAALYAMLVVVPLAIGGLVALLAARLLWRTNPVGVALALAWVAIAGLCCAIAYIATGNFLSAVRMIVVEAAGWSVGWPELRLYTDEGTYYSRLDDVTFWLPLVAAVAVVVVSCLLLAGRLAVGRTAGAART